MSLRQYKRLDMCLICCNKKYFGGKRLLKKISIVKMNKHNIKMFISSLFLYISVDTIILYSFPRQAHLSFTEFKKKINLHTKFIRLSIYCQPSNQQVPNLTCSQKSNLDQSQWS